jgi:nitrate reductase alpha subunit
MNVPIWIDILLGWLPFYQQLKTIAINAIILAEVNQSQSGSERKKQATSAIIQALKDLGIKITIPEAWLSWIISILIDAIVLALNTAYGKDWINKISQ